MTGSTMLGPQELFATVTIAGAGMRLNMYNVYNVDSAIYIHYMYPPTRVHSHCWIAGIEAKRVQCLRLRLNCALVGGDVRWFHLPRCQQSWE